MPEIPTYTHHQEMRNDLHNKLMDHSSFMHEHSLATKGVLLASEVEAVEQQMKTRTQVMTNRITTSIIDNQLSFYSENYDKLLNTVPNGYRG